MNLKPNLTLWALINSILFIIVIAILGSNRNPHAADHVGAAGGVYALIAFAWLIIAYLFDE